ncbi:MAG: flavin reductase family protein [Nanoarchaeota archaeon]|nr:flavin reductase family protein [Nanoarchaeota archaeon]MBU1321635.1 flavin reductase family protein [Nanoarchaeota archaeon]MBU1597419.1 flavin reductase family protein [Nanoarchaeota archaeon]MBU2440918.1 flavin reductase family protein [Nanoarchaeota archaeon]
MIWSVVNRNDLYPSVLVTVRAPFNMLGKEELKDNLSVVSWHMPASFTPGKYAISVPTYDNMKKMISTARNFVVNFMGNDQRSIVLSAESQDGVFMNLFDYLGVTRMDSERVESPRIKEAKAFLECEVEQELESGDHTIFVGKVVGPTE